MRVKGECDIALSFCPDSLRVAAGRTSIRDDVISEYVLRNYVEREGVNDKAYFIE